MEELELSVEQVAIAARVHKTTLYRLLGGAPHTPRPGTLRQLARALRIPLSDLTGQLEPEGLQEHHGPESKLANLLVQQYDLLDRDLRLPGATAAIWAMLDVEAGLGPLESESALDSPGLQNLLRRSGPTPSDRVVRKLLRNLFFRIPKLLQRTAVREAVRAMIDLQLRVGTEPTAELYSVAGSPQLQPTPSMTKAMWLRHVHEGRSHASGHSDLLESFYGLLRALLWERRRAEANLAS